MIDTVSLIVQVLSVTLSLCALLAYARAQWARTRRLEKQPVPIRVEREMRER